MFCDAVNWCKDESICVMAGQFFDLHREAIPDWLYLWQDQTHSIESLLRRFVTTAVQRYIGMVHLWHCHAGTLGQTKLGLNEEEQLRLTVAVIESIRQIDKSTPLLITIEQPFGEHMIRDELDLSPIQFADMLARGDIGVTGFNIRLNFGTSSQPVRYQRCLLPPPTACPTNSTCRSIVRFRRDLESACATNPCQSSDEC